MNDTVHPHIDALDQALQAAALRHRADVLLLSGGLDSSLLAAIWSRQGHHFRAFTVGADPTLRCTPNHTMLPAPCNGDLAAAATVAAELDLDWTPVPLDRRAAMRHLDWLVMQQRSFDLGQLNNIALVAALDAASCDQQPSTFATGDDADSLFGGYLIADSKPDWSAWLDERVPHIDPPASGIGSAMRWSPVFPWLDDEVIAIAKTLHPDLVRRAYEESEHTFPPSFMDQFDVSQFGASSFVWGKIALRLVAERYLPKAIAWRPKMDLEFGSGMCALESHLGNLLSTGVLMRVSQSDIQFFNDAHRGLYSRALSLGVRIPPVNKGMVPCPSCGGGVPIGKKHCTTCGHWAG